MTAKKRKRLVERGWALVHNGEPDYFVPDIGQSIVWIGGTRYYAIREKKRLLAEEGIGVARIVPVEIRELPPVRKPRKARHGSR